MADLTRKTANLFDKSTVVNDERVKLSGTEPQIGYSHTGYIDITGITALTVSSGAPTDATNFYFYNSIKADADSYYKGLTAIVPSEAKYVRVNMASTAVDTFMLNAGSAAKTYEPYGWIHSLRKLTTATEAIENPLYSDGTAITAYTLKGNEEHTGTPSPQNPVMPNGAGVRTENLWAENYVNISETLIYRAVYVGNGSFTLSSTVGVQGQSAVLFLLAGQVISGASTVNNGVWAGQNRTVTSIDGYVTIAYRAYGSVTPETADTMLNVGSTAKPYEPYGYKIPIPSGGVTTNIYLGSTQTVRQVKKLVLTGEEKWQNNFGTSLFGTLISNATIVGVLSLSTNYIYNPIQSGLNAGLANGEYALQVSSPPTALYIKDERYTTVDAWKSWLATQYANGTPVTVWYVLATPETAAVNEPLMKIGTYADTLSNATAIPTTEGANSITVDTTVQPSEFTATWTGWHNASVKEKSENYLNENDFGLVEVAAGVYRTGTDVGVLPSGTYTLSANKSSSAVQIYRTTKNGSTYNYETITNLPYTFTADGVSNQIFRTAGSNETSWADAGYSNVMLNTGETAQTYEPYWE